MTQKKGIIGLIIIGLLFAGYVPLVSSDTTQYNDYLKLGTKQGFAGEDWTGFERSQIKYQIKQLIPPNLQPAFTGDAYTLPPHAFRFAVSDRRTRIGGSDFFDKNGVDPIDLTDRVVRRSFNDVDLLYGFDLNQRFLHSFTLRINIPIVNSQVGGTASPLGLRPGMQVLADGDVQDLGDIGIFLKKKIQDQGNIPVGIAVMGGILLPTGTNSAKFANAGKSQVIMPDMSAMIAAQRAMMGLPPRNFSTDPLTAKDFPLNMPVPMSMLGGPVQVPFPLSSDNVFNRFSDDGRLPAMLQPGTGGISYMAGLFFTRQFLPGDWGVLDPIFGRSAVHIGATHNFVFEHDGIDPGDTTNFFASFVQPLFRDYLSIDTTFLGKRQETDHYAGKIIHPFPTMLNGAPAVVFREIDRPSFAGGISGYIAPSLIFSPDPQIRFTLSGLFRVKTPELGPAPSFISRIAAELTF